MKQNRRDKAVMADKQCPVCGRPFSWRRKWKACWDEVKYCSQRCRRQRTRQLPPSSG